MRSANNENKILLDDVMNQIKQEIRSVVNHYTGEQASIELIVNQECAEFYFSLDNKIEMKVILSHAIGILPAAICLTNS